MWCNTIFTRHPDSVAGNYVDAIAFIVVAVMHAKPPSASLKNDSKFHVSVPSMRCIKMIRPIGSKANNMVRMNVKFCMAFIISELRVSGYVTHSHNVAIIRGNSFTLSSKYRESYKAVTVEFSNLHVVS